MLKKISTAVFSKVGLRVSRLEGDLQASIPTTAYGIGRAGALEVFATYIDNYADFSGDSGLASFIEFYIQHYLVSASQWSQDIFVMYLSKMQRGGRFLEIGGADGFTHSNTYALEKTLDWSGLLIEPDPEQYKTLKSSRSGNHLMNSAISPKGIDETLILRSVDQLSTLTGYEGNDFHKEIRLASSKFTKVKAVNLTRIMCENQYDYLSLDVEGSEIDIIKSTDWDVIKKPRFLTIEYNFNPEARVLIVEFLSKYGYREHFASHDWLRKEVLWLSLQ